MLFWLMFPEGAQWKAYLTNDRDFILSGTTEGFAREGFRNEITIRPAGEFESDDIKTEFYILVNNLTSEVEVDVNHNEGSGPGNRYVIKYQR